MVEINENTLATGEDTQNGKYLTFSLDKETFGIEIGYVIEIVGIQSITIMPEMPEYIKGIINLRGKIIPVMDIRLRFNKDQKDYNDRTCIIVIEINDRSIGLIVDGVSEVIKIPEEFIIEPPKMDNGSNGFVKNIGQIGNEVRLLLDCEKLIIEARL